MTDMKRKYSDSNPDCICGDPWGAHLGQMGFGNCIVNCCDCDRYIPIAERKKATVRDE